jgi:hypothetical protein
MPERMREISRAMAMALTTNLTLRCEAKPSLEGSIRIELNSGCPFEGRFAAASG